MATKRKTEAQKAQDRRAKSETADANRYFESLAKKQTKRKGK